MNILERLENDYPAIGAEALSAMATIMEGMCDVQDEESVQKLLDSFAAFLSVLENDYSVSAQNENIVVEHENEKTIREQFKKALSEELVRREVPEYFWKAVLDVDVDNALWAEAADAIEMQYKAFLQQNNDKNMDAIQRPEERTRTEKHSSAVEAYIRSMRSDSPLAGRLKE